MTCASHSDFLAVIREPDCIGCMKCIHACPFDAIIGAQNFMHTVIANACNGCKLCLSPCPVDCIDLIELPARTKMERKALAEQSRDRFQKHKIRIEKEKQHFQTEVKSVDARRAEIQAIINRSRKK